MRHYISSITEHEIMNKYQALEKKKKTTKAKKNMDDEIIERLKLVLGENNRCIKEFQKAREWDEKGQKSEFSSHIIENRKNKMRQMIAPTIQILQC